jgi:hypothetical protein
MSSSTLTVVNLADANVVYTLVGQTANGASYKDATRGLSTPRTLEFQFTIGAPGALGNDKLVVTFSDAQQNAITGKVVVARARVELSVPRDAAITETMAKDLLAQVTSLLTDARIENIYDGIVP